MRSSLFSKPKDGQKEYFVLIESKFGSKTVRLFPIMPNNTALTRYEDHLVSRFDLVSNELIKRGWQKLLPSLQTSEERELLKSELS